MVANFTTDTTKTYTAAGTYTITLELTGGAQRWTFNYANKPLVPNTLTTANNVYVSVMPDLSWFGTSETDVGAGFFQNFNNTGALTSLPSGSFNTSHISGTV